MSHKVPDPVLQLEQARQAHRARNTLAIVRSVFARTTETAASPQHAIDHFQGRLDALARYHSRFASVRANGFSLETMVCDELLVFAFGDDPRVALSGPDVQLDHGAAEMIGLTLHELTTNSVKFGVLSDTDGRGRIAIRWSVTDNHVTFEWAESGVSILTFAPIPTGFGREFIEQALPYQLGAQTEFSIRPGGISCRIHFELKGFPQLMDLNP